MEFSQFGETVINILDRYGVLGVITIFLAILVFKFADQLIKLLAQKMASGEFVIHKRLSKKQRKDAIFKVNKLLAGLIEKLDADRVDVFEYHNGGYNLTGLPFLHFSLTTQRNRLGVGEFGHDFDNVLVSAVPDFISELDRDVIYIVDDLEELKPTFPRLHRELTEDGVKKVCFCSLEGVNDQVGFLMLVFKEKPSISKEKITKELVKKAQKVSTLLDYKRGQL